VESEGLVVSMAARVVMVLTKPSLEFRETAPEEEAVVVVRRPWVDRLQAIRHPSADHLPGSHHLADLH
jgi:hypothetical protein